jgi:hypothetical protein
MLTLDARVTVDSRIHSPPMDEFFFPVPDAKVRPGNAPGGGGIFESARRRNGNIGKHEAVDVLAEPGSVATAHVSGTVQRVGKFRQNPNDPFETGYVQVLTPNGYSSRMLYVDSDLKPGDKLVGGESRVGLVQDRYSGYKNSNVQNHVHLDVVDASHIRNRDARDPYNRFQRVDPLPHMRQIGKSR